MMWNGYDPMWGWGMMVFPFFGILFMIVFLFFMFQMFRGRSCFTGNYRESELDDLKREIRELKEEIRNMKSNRGGSS